MPNIQKSIVALLLAFSLALPAWAQEASSSGQPADTGQEETGDSTLADTAVDEDADESADEEPIDDSDLDEQTYEEDDDDFVPTEEIPADEPIPFPSNI